MHKGFTGEGGWELEFLLLVGAIALPGSSRADRRVC